MSYLYLLIGLVVLVFGGDYLVKSAVSITRKMNVSPLLIGVTVVSFGTSFPELLVSLQAAIDGNSGIAIGNVIGSNIANIGLVLGVTAVISPMLIKGKSYLSSWLFMLLSALLFIWFSIDLVVTFQEGLALVLLLIVFILFSIKFNKSDIEEIKNDSITLALPLILLYFILGSAGLYFGSELLVENAVTIAKEWGVSELVIGVTVIALGTSLPELVTSCLAAAKGHNNISVGNLIGSNIFNVFAVIGITSSFKPISIDESVLYFDFPVMLGITLFLGCILFWSKINRITGFALLTSYFAYILISIS